MLTLAVYLFLLLWLIASPILILILFRRIHVFSDSLATLTTDVKQLIAEGGPAAITAAVAAKDAADASAVDALDVVVKAALVPPVPPAA